MLTQMCETNVVVDFLRVIGIPVVETEVPHDSFLPGVAIKAGSIHFDRSQLLSAGDLLHEAGHLALLDPVTRAASNGTFDADGGYEMGAIAWSYAACLHLRLPVAVLFHGQGYRGGASSLTENFSQGRYVGVPMLAWLGLLDGSVAENTYPIMQRWLVKSPSETCE